MNLSNIKTGETYNNYKVLCEALEEAVKSGNSKRAQIKEWECYFSYYKDGHKYTIKEIYENPRVKYDKRTEGNNRKYDSIFITHPNIIEFIHDDLNYSHEKLTQFSYKELIWKCSECAEIFKKPLDNVCKANKVLCQKCSLSAGCRKIYDVLNKYKIEFQMEYSFDDLRGENNGLLRFDFAIFNADELLCLVEYDGEYHNEELNPDKDYYKNLLKHDNKKSSYCKQNNIDLIRIDYTQKDIEFITMGALLDIDIQEVIKKRIRKQYEKFIEYKLNKYNKEKKSLQTKLNLIESEIKKLKYLSDNK